jgi:hypothetical protein
VGALVCPGPPGHGGVLSTQVEPLPDGHCGNLNRDPFVTDERDGRQKLPKVNERKKTPGVPALTYDVSPDHAAKVGRRAVISTEGGASALVAPPTQRGRTETQGGP